MTLSPELIKSLTPAQKNELLELTEIAHYRWSIVGRPTQQLPIEPWQYWLIKAGRGFGKTRTGSEITRIWKENNPIILLAGRTASDARDIMIEGESGILATSPHWDRPLYRSSTRSLHWSNGAMALVRSADEPESFRGLQCYKAWCDELASWYYKEGDAVTDAWAQIKMGMRLGKNPQAIITTTPRNTKRMREIIKDPLTVITGGSTYDNKANLAPAFYNEIVKMYEGTRIGRQELHAELIEEVEGALWNDKLFKYIDELPELRKTCIALDPSITGKDDSDECGIICAGLGFDNYIYVFRDETGIYTPLKWANKAVYLHENLKANCVVAEVNQGGDMVKTIINQIEPRIKVEMVWSKVGKVLRAEPIVSLYEQGLVRHLRGLTKLENEMTTWTPDEGYSPGRIDALVHGINYLYESNKKPIVNNG